MNKKIIVVTALFSSILLITYKNFLYTVSMPAQPQLFEEIFMLLKQNKVNEAATRIDAIPILTPLRGNSNETLLHRAAELGNPTLLEMIVKKGVYVDTQDKYKQTPLVYAIKAHNVPNVKKLLALDANPFIKDIDNETALDTAKHYKSRFQMIGPHGIFIIGPVDPQTSAAIVHDFDTIINLLEEYQNN